MTGHQPQSPLLLSLRNVDFCSVLVLFLAFFLSIADYTWPIAQTFDSAKWYVFGAFILWSAFRSRFRIRRPDGPATLLLAFIVTITWSTVTYNSGSSDSDGTYRILAFMALFAISVLFPIPWDPIARTQTWTWVLVATSAITVVASSSVVGIYPTTDGGRLRGITSNANTLGAFAAIALVSAVWLLITGGRKIVIPSALLALLSGQCLFATGSRTAFLSALAGVVVLLFLGRRLFFGALVLVVALSQFPGVINTDVQGNLSTPLLSRSLEVGNRAPVWNEQLAVWRGSPWIGNGLVPASVNSQVGRRPGGEGSYTDLLAAAGLLGTVPLCLAFLIGVFRLSRAARLGKGTERRTAGLAAAVVVCIFANSIGEGFLASVGCVQALYCWVVLSAWLMHWGTAKERSLRTSVEYRYAVSC